MAKQGEKAEVSGVYRVTHDPAHKQPHEITMDKGHTFPPCPSCGHGVRYTLVRPTEHLSGS